jgi:hypothetical protein
LRDAFFKSFFETSANAEVGDVMGLPVIYFGGKEKKNLIAVVHPFWNMESLQEDSWLAVAKAELLSYMQLRGGSLSFLDTFNLQRRPGWCYEKVVRL